MDLANSAAGDGRRTGEAFLHRGDRAPGRRWLPGDMYGAALPFHVEFFFIGGASYFLYKYARGRAPRALPVVVLAGVLLLLLVTRGRPHALAPVYVWALILTLLCARPDDRSRE
ncbi:MAG TPA: hypothetical protein VI197_28325, partial [Polyangiaceae bacterium]